MDTKTDKKSITLDDLAKQVAEGFAKSEKQYEKLVQMTANGFNDITSRMATKIELAAMETSLKTDMANMETRLKTEIEGLRNSVNNYLVLSDKRYLELKHENEVYAKWFKALAEKVNLDLDFTELKKF